MAHNADTISNVYFNLLSFHSLSLFSGHAKLVLVLWERNLMGQCLFCFGGIWLLLLVLCVSWTSGVCAMDIVMPYSSYLDLVRRRDGVEWDGGHTIIEMYRLVLGLLSRHSR